MQSSRWLNGALLALLVVIPTINVNGKSMRSLRAVRLNSGYMEIVEEEKCSDSLLRLTCRSLRAFLFVLEAEYRRNNQSTCVDDNFPVKIKRSSEWLNYHARMRERITIELKGNYVREENEEKSAVVDLRKSFNRKCSGHHHCRFTVAGDHPGGSHWPTANLRLKYACIPDTAVRRYCNSEVTLSAGEAGYMKSPGYPLYYPGEYSCGWTFKTVPGQRVLFHFHDINIRSPEPNGNCSDVIRIEENGNTLFESCGTRVGARVISNSNRVTMNLVTSSRLYPARGFLLQYEAVGCPETPTPNGSFIANDTIETRTFQCHSGNIFPDTRVSTKTVKCNQGRWNESVEQLPNCVASSAGILKAETDHNHLSSLSSDGTGVRIGREGAVSVGSTLNMDPASPAMVNNNKQSDYVIDVLLPTILMALLFVGNAVIVYLIFQYRKRKVPSRNEGEELTLQGPSDVPHV